LHGKKKCTNLLIFYPPPLEENVKNIGKTVFRCLIPKLIDNKLLKSISIILDYRILVPVISV